MSDNQPQRCYRKSTRSGGSGGNCVEWAHDAEGVYVRDSKNPHGPELLLTPAAWVQLQDAAITGQPHPMIIPESDGVVLTQDGHRLNFTPAEWAAFQAGVLAGECQPQPAHA